MQDIIDNEIQKINCENDNIKKYIDERLSIDERISTALIYPYSKAIAQALVVPVPKTKVTEISYDELKDIKSERGLGALGSSNK